MNTNFCLKIIVINIFLIFLCSCNDALENNLVHKEKKGVEKLKNSGRPDASFSMPSSLSMSSNMDISQLGNFDRNLSGFIDNTSSLIESLNDLIQYYQKKVKELNNKISSNQILPTYLSTKIKEIDSSY